VQWISDIICRALCHIAYLVFPDELLLNFPLHAYLKQAGLLVSEKIINKKSVILLCIQTRIRIVSCLLAPLCILLFM